MGETGEKKEGEHLALRGWEFFESGKREGQKRES